MWRCSHLSDVLPAAGDELGEGVGLDGDLLLKADGHHGGLDLRDPGPLEAQVEAVVGEGPDLLVLAVVAHGDHGHLGRGVRAMDTTSLTLLVFRRAISSATPPLSSLPAIPSTSSISNTRLLVTFSF